MDIVQSDALDWIRIRKLLWIGLCASCVALVADILLGYGEVDSSLSGIEQVLSVYSVLPDWRIFWSAFLGLLAIPIEGLCYFAIYRMLIAYSKRLAHHFRSGIIGYLIFGACGVHVPCLAGVFFYKYMLMNNQHDALSLSIRFGMYFLLPAMILFEIFFFWMCITQIIAFSKGKTPYPKWCAIFNILVGMLVARIPELIITSSFTHAISAGWISVGNIWMFLGLILMMNKRNQE